MSDDTVEVVHVDGTVEVHPLPPEEKMLEALQGWAGGYIERIRLPGGFIMVVNEDGRPKRLPLNLTASMLADRPFFSPIVGDVVVMRSHHLK